MKKINLGAAAGDGSGDKIRVGGDKLNANFIEIIKVLFGVDLWDSSSDQDVVSLLSSLTTPSKTSFLAAINSTLNQGVVSISTKQYQLHKHLNNTDPTKSNIRQNNDIVYNVQWSATEVWRMAMCIDETKSADDRAAWRIYGTVGSTNDKPGYDPGDEIPLI